MTRDCARLYAVSDLHLNHEDNRQALLEIAARPDDWLILAGDVGETCAHLELALEVISCCLRPLSSRSLMHLCRFLLSYLCRS